MCIGLGSAGRWSWAASTASQISCGFWPLHWATSWLEGGSQARSCSACSSTSWWSCSGSWSCVQGLQHWLKQSLHLELIWHRPWRCREISYQTRSHEHWFLYCSWRWCSWWRCWSCLLLGHRGKSWSIGMRLASHWTLTCDGSTARFSLAF